MLNEEIKRAIQDARNKKPSRWDALAYIFGLLCLAKDAGLIPGWN